MTTVLRAEAPEGARPGRPGDERDDRLSAAAAALATGSVGADAVDPDGDGDEPDVAAPVSLRPVLAAGLSASGAALVIGGIFGSWPARLFGLAVAIAGAGLAAWALRSKRPALTQVLAPLLVLGCAALSVLPASPGELPRLVREAVDAGRLLRPPVPFDPGWRPVLTLVIAFVAFGAAWVGTAGRKPVLGVVIPIPLIALTAITQPEKEQVLAGIFAFLPILAGFGVLYGAAGGSRSTDGVLQRDFEVRRALRGGAVMVGLAVLLVGAGNLEFLFPKPTINPNNRPQKPKSVPLSAARDRVLFTVTVPPGFTGPWRTGVLDIYEDDAFKLAGPSPDRLRELPADGTIGGAAGANPSRLQVGITTGDLGATAVLPVVPTSTKVTFARATPDVRFDPRPGVLRFPAGRAPSGLTYSLSLPSYPTAAALTKVAKVTGDSDLMTVPEPPAAVREILIEAPPGPFARLDFVRRKLLDNITAVGPGSPSDINAARVQDMLAGSKKGTPFEIVAAQALLARWAGVPSRIAFGYNGVNSENGTMTVRPRNAAQWLEVRFDGYGWLPLLDVPPRAQADLNKKNDDNQRVLPSTDIAVEVFVPVEVPNPRLLFEQVRAVALGLAPFAMGLLALWLLVPVACRALRRRRRERWADALGSRARIAVAYAELRDAATDLSVGDPFATPLEYLARVQDDGEHTELAWLVSRAMYGDLGASLTEQDADAAEVMASSLRRRLRQAQPFQVRVVAALSKGSLLRPFTDEVPGINVPTPIADLRARRDLIRARRRRRAQLRRAEPRRRGWFVLPRLRTKVAR